MVIRLDDLKGALLSVDEVAELLGIKPDSVRRRIREGHIPARSVPGSHGYLILGDELIPVLMGSPATPQPRASTPKADDPGLPFDDAPAASQKARRATKRSKPTPSAGGSKKEPYRRKRARGPSPTPETGERFTMFTDHIKNTRGLSFAAIGREVGVNSGNLSRMRQGERLGSIDTLRRFTEVYGLNVDWLLTGDGDMIGGTDER